VVLATPRPSKRGLTAFSTPAGRAQDTPKQARAQGRVFGRRLAELTTRAVALADNQQMDVLVPSFLVSACEYIERSVEVEGVYRMSGSQQRQRAVRAEVEERGCGVGEVSSPPPVLDSASLVKQFLRELPEPVIPRTFHPLLAACHASPRPADNLQLALLLLPPAHSATLTFFLRHLGRVAAASDSNKMGASNLAIVLSPNLLPSQEVQAKAQAGRKAAQVDVDSGKLKQHTAILEVLVRHGELMGFLGLELEERYLACASNSASLSEGEVLEEEAVCGAARRRVAKKKHVRRRSGSLSRVLSVMGKAMGLGRATPGGKAEAASSVHSTPLPAFGGTPAFPSPRARQPALAKRDASQEHDLSPTKKVQRRTLESTFTPKMRKRSFSVKRFKRKKSDSKLKVGLKEMMVVQAVEAFKAAPERGRCVSSPPTTRASLSGTPQLRRKEEVDKGGEEGEDLEGDYAEVKAQYVELKEEVARLEAESMPDLVGQQFDAVVAAGGLARDARDTEQRLARVRRRSSEEVARKSRSPSQRRIGAIRRRSREREGREERGRSPAPRGRSPTCKAPITPRLVQHRPSLKLQRGQPNTTSVGLEKPLASPRESGMEGARRIKMSFKSRERPVVIRDGPVRATQSPLRRLRGEQESLVCLKNDISDLIEKSFGSRSPETEVTSRGVLETNLGKEEVDSGRQGEEVVHAPMFKLCEGEVEEVFCGGEGLDRSGRSLSSEAEMVELFGECRVEGGSPVTRAQLRRQSLSFQFARPAEVEPPAEHLRRQSSAFEFRSREQLAHVELSRGEASRASLRRRNSSVKDLILRLESAKRLEQLAPPTEPRCAKPAPTRPAAARLAVPEVRVESARARPVLTAPLRISEVEDSEQQESWVDGAAFFHNLKELNAPQCGRSSIVKIRKENRGRVQDTASKFATQTPLRPGRRQSVRLGTPGLAPALRLGHGASPLATPLGLPSGRRTTLTGIRTTAAARSYLNPTIASSARARDKSPLLEKAAEAKPRRSPAATAIRKKSPLPMKSPVYQNVQVERRPSDAKARPLERKASNHKETKARLVERKASNPRDIRKVPTSASVPRTKAGKVRRNKSTQERSQRRLERAEERRYLTIGCPGEVRSPLRERATPLRETQNLVRRSASDKTPGKAAALRVTRAGLAEQENLGTAQAVLVVRKHSLRSDALMSPHKVSLGRGTPREGSNPPVQMEVGSPVGRVKRVHSERSPRPRPVR